MSAADRDLILNALRDIPDGLGTRETVAEVLAEKLVAIEAGRLPRVEWFTLMNRWETVPDDRGIHAGASEDPAWFEARAEEYLAMARHLRAHPPVDEKAVDELQDALIAYPFVPHESARSLARSLVADGWTKSEAAR